MKLSVNDLKAALAACSDAVTSGSLIPDYSCIALGPGGMSAFNGVTGVVCSVAFTDKPQDTVVAPAARLVTYFAGYAENTQGQVSVSDSGSHIVFEVDGGGRIAITKPQLTGNMKRVELPKVAKKICTFGTDMFEAAGHYTCVLGVDETRPVTRNISLKSQSRVAWGTSGVAIGEYKLGQKFGAIVSDCILPHTFLTILAKYAASVAFDVYATKGTVYAKSKNLLISQTVQAFSYPELTSMLANYRKLTAHATVLADEFSEKLQRVGALTDVADKNMVTLSFKSHRLTLKCDLADGTSATEHLKYTGTVDEKKLVFNYTYLKNYVEVLAKAKAELKIGLVDGQKGVVLSLLPEFLFVVLPLQV